MKLSVLVFAAFALSALLSTQGCSSGHRTTTTTSVTRPDGGAPADDSSMAYNSGQTTTTTTTTTSDEPDSVLGATAHAVVTIILLPFRLVGDALGLIV